LTVRQKQIDRKVVPRFHGLMVAGRQHETASASIANADHSLSAGDELTVLLAEWESNRSPAFAADLVAAALVLGGEARAQEAAGYLLATSHHSLDKQLARRLLGEDIVNEFDDDNDLELQDVQPQIARLKRGVRADPRAALLWAELARRYATLGQRQKAADAMRVALELAPEDRFLLRSAARLNLHLDDPEKAHRLLTSALSTPHDPWLVAAEIAVAPLAGRHSRLIRHGKRLVESGKFRPEALSELQSALATEAMIAGSRKDTRRFFEGSLFRPTENSVAQAEWASRQGARIDVSEQLVADVEDSFEARAQMLSEAGDSERAIDSTWAWLRSEPFASLPAVFGSHEAALSSRYDEAIRFATFGLRANPDEFLLRNNIAFALASAGDPDCARRHLAEIELDSLTDEQQRVLTATRGLIAFRSGDISEGRRLYLDTIKRADSIGLRAIAAVLLAREEILAHTDLASAARAAAQHFADSAERTPSARADRVTGWLAHLEAETSD